jgi:hypothetical protein
MLRLRRVSRSERYVWPVGGALAALVLAGAGVLASLFAWTRDARWLELHATRHCCITDERAARALSLERWAGVACGAVLVLAAWPAARSIARLAPRAFAGLAGRCSLAAVLALFACEGILRVVHPVTPPIRTNLPTADPDEKLSWRYRPKTAKTTEFRDDGLTVEYDVDADGNRARSTADVSDRDAPTILFAGESITAGIDVSWEDTYSAIVARRLRLQGVNLGVHAYGVDQVYLRTLEALDAFHRPVALVTLFVADELERSVVTDRVHLTLDDDGMLVLQRPLTAWRESPLRGLFLQATHLRNGGEITLARTLLQRTVARARERGALPLFVMTNFGPPCVPDASGAPAIEHALFDDLGAPHLRVDLDTSWRLRGDPHPDARGHAKLADAIAAALSALGVGSGHEDVPGARPKP